MFSALIFAVKAVLLVASVTLMSLLFGFLFLSLRGQSARKKVDAFRDPNGAYSLLKALSWHVSMVLQERRGLSYEVNLANLFLGECMRAIRRGLFVEYFGRNQIFVVFRADHVGKVLSSSRNYQRGLLYDIFVPWVGRGLVTSSGAKWKPRRKMLTPSFHFRILRNHLVAMNEQAALFADIISRKADNEDISLYVEAFTLDVTGDTIMGTSINCQTSDNGKKYLERVKLVTHQMVKRLFDPSLWFDFVYKRTEVGRQFYKAIDDLHEFSTNIINIRKEELLADPEKLESLAQSEDSLTYSKKPFLDILLVEHLKRGTISTVEIREEVDTFIAAGHETTAVTLLWALHFIGYFPEVQRRLQEEIDRCVDKDGSAVSEEQLKELTYLDMVLKESQRLRPTVPFFGRWITEEIQIEGKPVPAGSEVLVNSHALHRNPDVFPKPEEFDPERFSTENSRNRNPYAYLPFSAGPRNCIGQRFAMLMMKTFFVWVLRRYNLKSLNHQHEIIVPLDIVQRPISGMHVAFTKRSAV